MENKNDNDERRSNFNARHGCADKNDKTKAGYWACRVWKPGFKKSSAPTAPEALR